MNAVVLYPAKSPEAVDIISPLSAFGDLRNAELSPIFQYSFEYTVDNTELNTNTVVAGGAVTQASGMAVVGTSITTASSALLVSKRKAKYKSGLGGLARITTLFETGGVAATVQHAGLIDEVGSSEAFNNGYTIGFEGTVFGFHRFQNDVLTTVAQANWDDPLDGSGASGMTLDTSKLNVWEIQFQYLGSGAITLLVEDDSTGKFVKIHTILYANLNIIPSVFMPNFQIALFVDNKATTSDLIVKSSSFSYFVEGKAEPILTHQPQQSTGIISKAGVSTEVAIFTIRNKTTYASKTNFIEINLEKLAASIEASSPNNLGEIRIVRNTTLGGTPSYSDINTTDSVVEIDTSGTTLTGGKELFSSTLAGKNDKVGEEGLLTPFDFIIPPGETVTVAGTSANSATMPGSLLWKELF